MIANLETRSWYRLLKVIFILIAISLTLLVAFFAYLERPQKFISASESSIICNNGNTYKAFENNIYDVERLGKGSSYDNDAIKLCTRVRYKIALADGRVYQIETDGMKTPTETDRNEIANNFKAKYGVEATVQDMSKITPDHGYTVKLGYSTSGSWESVAQILGGGLLAVFLIFEFIRRTFFYVATGKNFWHIPVRFKRKDNKTI